MQIDSAAEIEKIMRGLYPGNNVVPVEHDDADYEGYAAFCFDSRADAKYHDLAEMSDEQLYDYIVPTNLKNKRIAIVVPSRILFSSFYSFRILRKRLIDENIIEAVCQPSDVYNDNVYARLQPYMKDMAVVVFSENNSSVRFRYENIVSGRDFEIVASTVDLKKDWHRILFPTMVLCGQALSDYSYKLEDIASVKQGFNLSRRRPSQNSKIQKVDKMDEDTIFGYANRGYRGDNKDYKYLVGMNNISDTMILHNICPVTVEDDPSLEFSKLRPGDIVLTIRGVYLKAALVDYDDPRSLYATNDVCRIRPNVGIPGEYILAMLESDLFAYHLHLCCQMRTLRVSEIKNMPINCEDIADTKWMRNYVENYSNDRNELITAKKVAEYRALKMKMDLENLFSDDLKEKIEYTFISIEE